MDIQSEKLIPSFYKMKETIFLNTGSYALHMYYTECSQYPAVSMTNGSYDHKCNDVKEKMLVNNLVEFKILF